MKDTGMTLLGMKVYVSEALSDGAIGIVLATQDAAAVNPATAAQLRSTAMMIENCVATGGLSISREMKADHIARLNALASVLERISGADVHVLSRYVEMACSCGVITKDDQIDWDAAVGRVPKLLDALRELAPK